MAVAHARFVIHVAPLLVRAARVRLCEACCQNDGDCDDCLHGVSLFGGNGPGRLSGVQSSEFLTLPNLHDPGEDFKVHAVRDVERVVQGVVALGAKD